MKRGRAPKRVQASTTKMWHDFADACLREAGINRAELARRLGVSEQRVYHIWTQENITLRQLADIAWACGVSDRVRVQFIPLDKG